MSNDILVTVDQCQTSLEVAAIGIQGLSGIDANVEDIGNVEALNALDGSVLVLDVSRGKWVATTILEKQDITGGQY